MTQPTTNEAPAIQSRRFDWNWLWLVALALAVAVLPRLIHFGYVGEDKQEAATEIDNFHIHLKLHQFDQIYDEADAAFRAATTREHWLQHMQENQERYGALESSTLLKINVLMRVPIQVRAAYASNFERGQVTELFAYAREAHKLQLLAYGISTASPSNAKTSR